MRLCRFIYQDVTRLGIYEDSRILDLPKALSILNKKDLAGSIEFQDGLLELLPPDGLLFAELKGASAEIADQNGKDWSDCWIEANAVRLLPPIIPNKLLLLAGNYVEHVKEQGDIAAERQNTFPYVFSKPPTTTMIGSGATFFIPDHSPNKIDYELELAVVIGRRAKRVSPETAMQHVAGYMVINDISDRGYRPNPSRQERPRDKFFDWLHGKWHDGSCPCGPCLVTADDIPDPHSLAMKLSIDGETRQDASTNQQVFSIAETISFISDMMTLEPGDVISTGTPSGVGNATGRYLQTGQKVEAWIERIGTLVTRIE